MVNDGRMTQGKPRLCWISTRLRQRVRHGGARALEPDFAHGVAEQLAVFGHVDGFTRGGDQLDAVARQHPFAHQVERRVQRGLATHGGQQRVGLFLLDDARHRAPVDGLDVDGVGHLRVGHDGGRVRVHEDDAVALLAAAPCRPARRSNRTRTPGR